MTETWLPVPGYEGSYEVSDQGSVRGVDRTVIDVLGRIHQIKGTCLRGRVNSGGYPHVGLSTTGEGKKQFNVAELVLLAFVGPRPKGMVIRHLNDVKTDSRLVNLRYGTFSENLYDAWRNGGRTLPTHCAQGHEFTPDNIYLRPGYGPRRYCRECNRIYTRLRRLKHSAVAQPS